MMSLVLERNLKSVVMVLVPLQARRMEELETRQS